MAAEDRIEAEFSDRKENPDPTGSKTIEVTISNYNLDIDDVNDIDYVNDVIPEDDEFRVFVSADSGNYFAST